MDAAMSETRKITPCLWFDFNAEEAVGHYLSIFRDARIVTTTRYGAAGPGPAGAVMTMLFEIEGKQFLALNGGLQIPFTPAISLILECKTQEEIDTLWEKLGEGGKPGQCGWLADKFGVTWQIVPSLFSEVVSSGDAEAIERAMRAILPMKKLDIAKISEAVRPR
jgi:predicted 3-demethylubiquinone-9 3-methyltransferase (glyoxalase superfamily)